jgi:endoglucanase
MARGVWGAALVVAASLLAVLPGAHADGDGVHHRQPTPVTAFVRVNQQGWLRHETKQAILMASGPLGHTTFAVVGHRGHVVLRGTVPSTPVGSWSSRFPAVYRLDLSALHKPGRYRIRTHGAVSISSPHFLVAGAEDLYSPILDHGVAFDQNQRDGDQQLPGPLDRQPSHLNDAQADVYAWPHMVRGEDLITDADLTRIGGPVDVEGGWADAGDYLKFTHSTAYNDVVLFSSARLLGARAPSSLVAEARHGLDWLGKMWDEQTGTLHLQVGIGSGNRQGTFAGDHDLWRLPQADDQDTDPMDRYVAHRPVFDAAPAGQPISPNLAGRVSAAFALAAQLDAAADPAQARDELHEAQALYARADTATPPRPLVTALPHAFYPESVWQDDMELGAAEIARAARRLGEPASAYLTDAAHWAKRYLKVRSTDTLNLYDVGALAHASLADAMVEVAHGHLEVTRGQLTKDLARQIRIGVGHARHDPFRAAVDVTEFDANSHSFGLVASVALYDRLTDSHRFRGFATAVRTWLLGGNPWGVSAMVGIGSSYPRCMQHQVANLAHAPDLGAVVNGPNGAGNFEGGLGGFQDDMEHCSRPGYAAFDGQGSRYVDDVRAWQTDEPALDMTGAAILAAAAALSLDPKSREQR